MYHSRLQKLEEKQNLRQATLISLGTVLLIATTLILGIPLLIRLAGFLGELKSTDRPIDKNDTIPPVPPQVSLPFDATNSAQLTLTGNSEPGATVFLTLNEDSSGDVVVSDNGSFTLPQISLTEGDNALAIVAVDQSGNKSVSATQFSVYFSQKAPDLQVDAPTDNQQVTGNTVEVKGNTTPGMKLTINGRLIIVASDGNFATNLNLNPGENPLVIVASDKLGNQARKELTVISNQ